MVRRQTSADLFSGGRNFATCGLALLFFVDAHEQYQALSHSKCVSLPNVPTTRTTVVRLDAALARGLRAMSRWTWGLTGRRQERGARWNRILRFSRVSGLIERGRLSAGDLRRWRPGLKLRLAHSPQLRAKEKTGSKSCRAPERENFGGDDHAWLRSGSPNKSDQGAVSRPRAGFRPAFAGDNAPGRPRQPVARDSVE